MAKKVITEPGRTFSEFSLLTGFTKRDCTLQEISLDTDLAGLHLKIPLLSAAMTSVTGYDLALALGKEGGIGVLPARLPVQEQAAIVRKLKRMEMGFVQEPITTRENRTIEEVLRWMQRHGHSKIPIVDKNNKLLGMFTQKHYLGATVSAQDSVTAAMIPYPQGGITFIKKPDITAQEAKRLMESQKCDYLIVLDEQDRLVKLAFRKDVEKIKVAAAISTHEDWQERVKANIQAGADLIVIDTSDAHTEFATDVIKQYKAAGYKVPLCAGNVITYEGALCLMEAGADMIKVGMSSGSICITKREKATGRAPMTALLEADRARKDFAARTGKHVPVIADGGIKCAADMIIALAVSDAVMLGGYFNKFYEAAGEKLDDNGHETHDETLTRWVASWGEGSERAQNLDRYGHSSRKTFFAEGVEGRVPFQGRLKPTLKKDLMKIKAALSNAGCANMEQFRANAVLELNSQLANDTITNAIKEA